MEIKEQAMQQARRYVPNYFFFIIGFALFQMLRKGETLLIRWYRTISNSHITISHFMSDGNTYL